MSGSREQAEEVVQEVFLVLLSDGVRFDEERGGLEALLIGITRNQVRRLRREAWRTQGLQEKALRKAMARVDIPSTPAQDDDVDLLRRAVVALPESYRAVTVLCDLQQLTYAEAAERLGCAVGTVRSRLHRARSILEAKLRRKEQCRATTVS